MKAYIAELKNPDVDCNQFTQKCTHVQKLTTNMTSILKRPNII